MSHATAFGREVWIPAVYLVLVGFAAALPAITGSPLAGIWAVLLTMPWSMLLVTIGSALAPELFDSSWVVMSTVALFGLINAFLLHRALRSGWRIIRRS